MITEDYVSFETAKPLKEKGFDEKCFYCFDDVIGESRLSRLLICNNSELVEHHYSAPTLQMAMKWLREVHKIHIEIGYNVGYFPVCISTKTNETIPYKPMQGKDFTYEQACEVAIKYCLENLI